MPCPEGRTQLRLEDLASARQRHRVYKDAQQIRRAGYCRTSGEVFEGKTGITAPIFGRSRLVVASVTVLGDDVRFALFNKSKIAQLVMDTAQVIRTRSGADEHL